MNEQTRLFIRDNAEKDIRTLALSGKRYPEVDMPFALDQIAGRQTARKKLPTWAEHDDIIYPPHLSMEQCSSEQTARYKMHLSSLCPLPSSFVDLTGGFGVDFSYMSQGFQKAVYVERQEHLCDIARNNFRVLGLENAEVVHGDGVEYLNSLSHVSVIYLDPARRNEHGGKTYAINDCTPDVTEIRHLLIEKSDKVIVKLSPMLDWRKAVGDLDNCVSEVHIVSVDNECKELLLVMERNVVNLKVVCVNNNEVFSYVQGGQEFKSFSPSLNNASGVQTLASDARQIPQAESNNSSTRQLVNLPTERTNSSTFLYEPNASIMKAGCFDLLEDRYGVRQLERNSHLFVSESLIEDFPGRKFKIEAVTSLNKKDIKKTLSGIDKANISVRNFPMSVDELRKRLKIKEGGSDYIFATTLADKSHVLLLCRRKAASQQN